MAAYPSASTKRVYGGVWYLDSALIPHGFKTLIPLIDRKGLIHDPLDFNLSGIQVRQRVGELKRLGEGSDNCDFVAKDFGGWPDYTGFVAVDSVDDEFTAAADIVNCIFEDFGTPRRFNDNIKPLPVSPTQKWAST